MIPKKYTREINRIIAIALNEDIGKGDITTNAFISQNQISKAALVTRENAVIYGLKVAKRTFEKLDRTIGFKFLHQDGDRVPANTTLAIVKGKTRALLSAERVALNFLCRLSGIATTTAAYLHAIRPYRVKILDTRKTTPGLRTLEKLAVKAAGGTNHRQNLNEMVMIKDNHKLAILSKISLQKIIAHAKKKTRKPIEVEVDNLRDFKAALLAKPDFILLDNMTLTEIKQAVAIKKTYQRVGKPLLEVSGGVNLKNIRSMAQTGVDRISVGALTHSSKAVDIALEFFI